MKETVAGSKVRRRTGEDLEVERAQGECESALGGEVGVVEDDLVVLGDEGGGVCGADPAAHVRAGERAHGGCRSGLHRFVGVLQRVLQEVKVHARLRLRGRAGLPEAAGLRGVLCARLLPGEQRQLQEGDGGD